MRGIDSAAGGMNFEHEARPSWRDSPVEDGRRFQTVGNFLFGRLRTKDTGERVIHDGGRGSSSGVSLLVEGSGKKLFFHLRPNKTKKKVARFSPDSPQRRPIPQRRRLVRPPPMG